MDEKLLAIIVCPACKGKLEYKEAAQELHCLSENIAYPIRSGIPILLMEAAISLTRNEQSQK